MENGNLKSIVLEYLQKNGSTNTFKLAHVLEIKREKLLRILRDLEERGLIRIITGKAEFLSHIPQPPKKRIKTKQKFSKKKAEIEKFQEEIKSQKSYIEKLKDQIKKLEQRPPKVITKTIVKKIPPKIITKTIVKEVEPIKAKRKPKRKKKKVKEPKLKLKKIVKRGIKLRKELKKIKFKKYVKGIPRIKIKGGFGVFKTKKFIKYLKDLERR